MNNVAANTNKIHSCHVIQYPSGRFGFAGKVPAILAWMRKDGKPMSAQDWKDVAHAGPLNVYKMPSFDTKEMAEAILSTVEAA